MIGRWSSPREPTHPANHAGRAGSARGAGKLAAFVLAGAFFGCLPELPEIRDASVSDGPDELGDGVGEPAGEETKIRSASGTDAEAARSDDATVPPRDAGTNLPDAALSQPNSADDAVPLWKRMGWPGPVEAQPSKGTPIFNCVYIQHCHNDVKEGTLCRVLDGCAVTKEAERTCADLFRQGPQLGKCSGIRLYEGKFHICDRPSNHCVLLPVL